MSKKPPSRDEALEAIDFIVNVLKEHEKDLDRLINELGTVTERMGDTGELSGKVEKVEERLSTLQNEITNLITYLSGPHETITLSAGQPPNRKEDVTQGKEIRGPPVIMRCKQWEDFQNMASHAQSVSFLFREPEKTFQVDALKNNQIVTYSGELPKSTSLLKAWLAKQLSVEEKNVLEGILAIG
ncbi:MAG: hypothetical protein ABSC91_01565 [Candidatus Bathyarchaeia archaeon]|jgi:hypothetical protein